jgi:flagellin
MALTLNTNVASLSTQNYLSANSASATKSLASLSSGSKLNSASDDPAGYAIAFKLSVKAASMSSAIDNGNQGLAMLQVAQGGMEQVGNILTQLKQIATLAASSNIDLPGVASLEAERVKLFTEIDNIAANTQYGGTQLLQGSNTVTAGAGQTTANGIANIDATNAKAGGFTLTVGGNGTIETLTLTNGTTSQTVTITASTGFNTQNVSFNNLGINLTVNASLTTIAAATMTVTAGTSNFSYQLGSNNATTEQISLSIGNFGTANATGLNLTGDISTQANARAFMTTVDAAINWLNTQTGALGATQNEMDYQVANLESMHTNTMSAASTIKDTDYAKTMSDFTSAQIATQAGVAMLSQANQMPQQILSLLKG